MAEIMKARCAEARLSWRISLQLRRRLSGSIGVPRGGDVSGVFIDVEEAMISLACSSAGTSSSSGRSAPSEFVDPRRLRFAACIPGPSSRLDRAAKPVVRDNEFHVSTGSTKRVVWRRIGERTASAASEGSGP